MFDLIIKGGRVVDGTGRAAFNADVAVERGAIAAIGQLGSDAKRVIDAKGRVVAPASSIHTRTSTCNCCGMAQRVRRSSTA